MAICPMMGPTILLDKSAFQKCRRGFLPLLYYHYSLVVPPILIREVLEDHAEDPNKFMGLVRRFNFMEMFVTMDCRLLREGELLGHRVEMQGRPCFGGNVVNTSAGAITILKPSQEEQALRRWQGGNISNLEKELASKWQQTTDSFDMERLKAELRKHADGIPQFGRDKVAAIAEMGAIVDWILLNPNQLQFLEIVLQEQRKEIHERVRLRWKSENPISLKQFAPFVYHCLKVNFIFALGLVRNLISSEPNTLLDLQYLYYLPFCEVFVSDDKFHKSVQALFLRPNQVFMDYKMLERALDETRFFFENLSQDEARQWFEKKGHCPPRAPLSITGQMYKRFWNIPDELQGNMTKKISKELTDFVVQKVKAARSAQSSVASAQF
jgi:hypothetical protein